MVTFDDNANNIWNEMRGQIRRRVISDTLNYLTLTSIIMFFMYIGN